MKIKYEDVLREAEAEYGRLKEASFARHYPHSPTREDPPPRPLPSDQIRALCKALVEAVNEALEKSVSNPDW